MKSTGFCADDLARRRAMTFRCAGVGPSTMRSRSWNPAALSRAAMACAALLEPVLSVVSISTTSRRMSRASAASGTSAAGEGTAKSSMLKPIHAPWVIARSLPSCANLVTPARDRAEKEPGLQPPI